METVAGRLRFETFEVSLARAMRNKLPIQAVEMIQDPQWAGSKLVQLEGETVRPSVKDLKQNACWLIPICQYSPQKAFMLLQWLQT